MKKVNKLLFSLVMGAALMGGATSCDDFEETILVPLQQANHIFIRTMH